jgi:hypothetical protein
MRVEGDAQPVVEGNGRSWMYATVIIIICLTALVLVAIKGL